MTLSPFRGRGFYDLHSEMNRLFNQTFGNLLGRTEDPQRQQVSQWAPSVDVLNQDTDLVIKAELPGVKLEDVDITLQDNVLTISGEHKAEQEEEREGGYYLRERRYGSFRRSIPLPEDVDEENIHARFEDGVLEVRVEGAAAVQEPKRIQVEGGEGSGREVSGS